MAARIQSTWRGYLSRKNPLQGGGMHAFVVSIKKANKLTSKAVKRFKEIEKAREQQEMLEEKKRWLNYTLPKLHHLIRTKEIPGIYSLKDGRQELSFIERLLNCYDFSNFMHELNYERKKFSEQFQSLKPAYRFQGSFRKCEQDWKQQYLLQNPKL
ncbi:hypothetical protein O3M35_009574 [Rhynocoris fuscipes]|uniref:Uncharacterized protein n=1 Tax=Rhynocoris fuscipes TaxID=488301 RepID=A0AAW1D8T3_9HEMI